MMLCVAAWGSNSKLYSTVFVAGGIEPSDVT